MKKIISLCMSLILLSLSVAASASVDIIYTQGDTMIKGIVSAGELEYATEATVTVFDEDGNLQFETNYEEGDFFYDEIGSVLKIKQYQSVKQELLESLETYYRIVFLGEGFEEE